MDNYFASIELFKNLLHNKNLRATGTIKSNRKDLPENFGKEKLNKASFILKGTFWFFHGKITELKKLFEIIEPLK